MKVLITAGGTQEYIDDVRVITNISTGKLGATIAQEFLKKEDEEVFYIHSKTSAVPVIPKNSKSEFHPIEVRTANDALEAMKTIITENKVHAVVHSMAVSDFTFLRDIPMKCKSNDPVGFIDHLKNTIRINPKIISMIKNWYPRTVLVGFKFEVGKASDELIALAKHSIKTNKCDLVIANDKKEMERCNQHVAHFVFSEEKNKNHFENFTAFGKEEIARKIYDFLEKAVSYL